LELLEFDHQTGRPKNPRAFGADGDGLLLGPDEPVVPV
jgi:hypothetical protein